MQKVKIIGILLGVLLLAGCGERGEESPFPEEAQSEAPQAQAETVVTPGENAPNQAVELSELTPELREQLVNRYIIPYEYYCGGYEWNFADPHHVYDYDPDDLEDMEIHLEYITSGFGVSVLVRELSPEEQEPYIYERSSFGTGYNLTGPMHEAVSAFYFGVYGPDFQENSPYAEDVYDGGLPTNNFQDGVPVDISLREAELLPDGTVRAVVDRTLRDSGMPVLSAEYLFQPFMVESPPPLLQPVYSDGDLAFRFLSVSDIPLGLDERVTVPINSVEDLLGMARDADSGDPAYLRNNYILQADLDLTGIDWEPAGQYRKANRHDPNTTGFGAVFDGAGHTIRGLIIHRTVDATELPQNLGLFSTIARTGEVRDLHIADCDIWMEEAVMPLQSVSAGGLAGVCFGRVSGCTVTGMVAGTHQVGGLVGCAAWASEYESCAVNVQVTGSASIGGFAGAVHNATVTACDAKGQVTSIQGPPWYDGPPQSIGGFTGSTTMGLLQDCRAAVEVKTQVSSNWVGGFVGYHQGTISRCRYDSALTAGWEGADVVYQDAPLDLEGVPGLEF